MKVQVPLSAPKETFEEIKPKKAESKQASDLLWSGVVFVILFGVMMLLYLLTE